MATVDPLQSALDAANKLRDGIMPRLRDRFAQVRKPRSRLRLDQLQGLSDQDALAALDSEVRRYGEAEVERRIRGQVRGRRG